MMAWQTGCAVLLLTAFAGACGANDAGGSLEAQAAEVKSLIQRGRYAEAQQKGQAWAAAAEKSGSQRQQAEAMLQTGRAFLGQHKSEEARDFLARATELGRKLGDDTLLIETLLGLAQAESGLNRHEAGGKLATEAEGIWARKKDPELGVRIQMQRVTSLHELRQPVEAQAAAEEALAEAKRTGNRRLIATTLVNLGQIHSSLHQYPEAADSYRKALEFELDPPKRLITLIATGICEYELNRFGEAYRTFEAARKEALEQGNQRLEAWALGELGLAVWKLEADAARATGYFERAMERFEKSKDQRNALVFLENKGNVYRDQRRFEEALRIYREVERKTTRMAGLSPSANLYKSIGQCLVGLGRDEEAARVLRDAIEKAKTAGDTKRVWQGHRELARLSVRQGRREEAEADYLAALASIESMRRTLRLEAFKTDFFEDKVEVYEEYAGLLVDGGAEGPRVEEAFAVAERARARSFLDSLAESRAAPEQVIPQRDREEETAILARISQLQRVSRSGGGPPGLEAELAAAEERLEQHRLKVIRENERFGEVRYPQPAGYAEIRKLLGPGEYMLAYFLGKNHSHGWLASAEGLEWFRLPPREEVERAVRAAYGQLATPGKGRPDTGALAGMLLGPAASKGEIESLIIVPSGILHYFPFEALAGGTGKDLVHRARISYLPSASALAGLRTRGGARIEPRLLAVGDGIYGKGVEGERSGSGLLRGIGELPPIPHTRTEAEELSRLFGRGRSRLLLGSGATEHEFKRQELARFSLIHLAGHGLVDSSSAARSGIVFGLSKAGSEDGILQVREIYRLKLRASLVTLSACQSALGRLATGEGMVGLSRAFFFAGAESVIASLWNVNDRATAEFMKQFYGQLQGGRSKAEALRQAKIKMASSGRYSHPYYWAPYVLIGEGSTTVEFPGRGPERLVYGGLVLLAGVLILYWRRSTSSKASQPDSSSS